MCIRDRSDGSQSAAATGRSSSGTGGIRSVTAETGPGSARCSAPRRCSTISSSWPRARTYAVRTPTARANPGSAPSSCRTGIGSDSGAPGTSMLSSCAKERLRIQSSSCARQMTPASRERSFPADGIAMSH